VLVTLSKLLAPFIPFTAEAIYQNLVRGVDDGAPLSVHHTFYPAADTAALDRRLLDKMRLVINTAALGRSARGETGKLRQPLARARVFVGSQQQRDDLRELADVLAEEINVKEIDIVSEVGELVSYKLLPNNRTLGPKFGPLFPAVRAALATLDPAAAATSLQAGELLELSVDGRVVSLSGDDVLVQTEPLGGLAVAGEKGVTVAVDPHLTPALAREGYARDLVRVINTLRKDAGFDISDRVTLGYEAEGEVAAALSDFAEFIAGETLAVEFAPGLLEDATLSHTAKLGDDTVKLSLRKI
jgi:isoleucyl-tRNA synthetase